MRDERGAIDAVEQRPAEMRTAAVATAVARQHTISKYSSEGASDKASASIGETGTRSCSPRLENREGVGIPTFANFHNPLKTHSLIIPIRTVIGTK